MLYIEKIKYLKFRRAEEKVRNEIDNRREKLAEEMRSREVKCLENRREKEQAKRQKLKITKKKIEEKDRKVRVEIQISIFHILVHYSH